MSVWMKKEDWINEGFMDAKIIKTKRPQRKVKNIWRGKWIDEKEIRILKNKNWKNEKRNKEGHGKYKNTTTRGGEKIEPG